MATRHSDQPKVASQVEVLLHRANFQSGYEPRPLLSVVTPGYIQIHSCYHEGWYMAVETEVVGDGLRFIATNSGKTYRSLNYHRATPSGRPPPATSSHGSTGGRKSLWAITQHDEFALFSTADDLDWKDPTGYWAIRDGGRDVLGTKHERIAHFPQKAQSADDWHGYPLYLSPVRRPDATVALEWIANETVSFAIGQKILRGKL
jgi:hypothetical protein